MYGKENKEIKSYCAIIMPTDSNFNIFSFSPSPRLLALVSRDLVAAEGHYHRSCYCLYTKGVDNTAAEDVGAHAVNQSRCDINTQYEAAEKQSFSELFSYIREELFVNSNVVPMTDLTARLAQSMGILGVATVKSLNQGTCPLQIGS